MCPHHKGADVLCRFVVMNIGDTVVLQNLEKAAYLNGSSGKLSARKGDRLVVLLDNGVVSR